MISNLNQSSEAFLTNVARVQRAIDEASRQVSSGKRVNVASDAPAEIDTIMQLQTGAVRNDQIKANLAIAKTEANSADSALSAATKIMDRAVTLAAQGSNFSLDANGRQSIAGEAQSLLEQMVTLSRTTVQGHYIFGADRDGTPPYQVDLTTDNGVERLTSSVASRRIEDASGGTFAATKSAQDIFDARNVDDSLAPNNVFTALNSLRVSLLSNDTTQINAAADSIKGASASLNLSQGFYGTVLNRIQDASSYASTYGTELRLELGQKQDADVTAAALALTQGNTQLQAAFALQAKMPRTTLFDFMG
jgi:flagellar hook-associated protein 3 FlgL